MVIEYIARLWPLIIGLIGIVAWLVRVDNRTMDNAKTIARVERESAESLEKLETRIEKRRSEDIARLEKVLEVVSSDIKALLQRSANG